MAADEFEDLANRLLAASNVGGPLDGWLFHGTTEGRARSIEAVGLRGSFGIASLNGTDWFETDGATHWASARLAISYAKDWREKTGDPALKLAIVACRLVDLKDCGDPALDGQTVDFPVYGVLRRSWDEISEEWERSTKDVEAHLRIFETLLVLGTVPADRLRVLRSAADVSALTGDPRRGVGR